MEETTGRRAIERERTEPGREREPGGARGNGQGEAAGREAKPGGAVAVRDRAPACFFALDGGTEGCDRLWLVFRLPLSADWATGVSLLSRLLSVGGGPAEMRERYHRLEGLWGASLTAAALKKGDEQLLSLQVSVPRPVRGTVWDTALEVLRETVEGPLTEGFSAERVNREKLALARALLSRQDDRFHWAQTRCLRWMCRNEVFGVDADGAVERLPDWTAGRLHTLYRQLVGRAPAVIVYAGRQRPGLEGELRGWLDGLRQGPVWEKPVAPQAPDAPRFPHRVFEPCPGRQAQLVMGWRSQGGYLPLQVAAEVLGGGGASRLFASLREAAGLCYSVGAVALRHQRILLAQAGLLPQAVDGAGEQIARAVAELPHTLEEAEVAQAKRSLGERLRGRKESPAAWADFVLDQILAGEEPELEAVCRRLETVTRDETAQAAAGLKLDTLYVLAERM